MLSGGVSLDGDYREGGVFTFSAIRLKLAFSEISNCTFKSTNTGEILGHYNLIKTLNKRQKLLLIEYCNNMIFFFKVVKSLSIK